jgi:hypothetical protein
MHDIPYPTTSHWANERCIYPPSEFMTLIGTYLAKVILIENHHVPLD